MVQVPLQLQVQQVSEKDRKRKRVGSLQNDTQTSDSERSHTGWPFANKDFRSTVKRRYHENSTPGNSYHGDMPLD